MNRNLLALGLVGLVLAVQPVAAIWVPQTRREFVKAVSEGAGATAMERYVVDRGVGQVYSLLKRKSSICLNVQVRRSGFVGNQMEVSSTTYNPTVRMVGGERAEFTLQVVHRPRGLGHTPPAGGLYVMAADVRPLGRGRSEVLLYRPTIGYKKVVNAFRQWTAGEDVDCPKLR